MIDGERERLKETYNLLCFPRFSDVWIVCVMIKCCCDALSIIFKQSGLSCYLRYVVSMFIHSGNEIGDEGARHLSAALSQCASLASLNLGCKMSSFTLEILFSSLFCVILCLWDFFVASFLPQFKAKMME